MEITYTQQVNYSMELNVRKIRELADHLDITLRELRNLIERGDLLDEYEGGLLEFMELNDKLAEETERSSPELDQITW